MAATGTLRPLEIGEDTTAMLVSPKSPRRFDGTNGRQSPGSPVRIGRDLPMSSSTEYRDKFVSSQSVEPMSKSGPRGASSSTLWLRIGGPEYSTETRDKFSGHQPPPAAARAIPKHEPNRLPFHDATIYRESFQGVAAPRPDVYKPKQQTEKLAVPMSSSTEYRASYASRAMSPTKSISLTDWRPEPKKFFGLTQYGEAFTGEPVASVMTHTGPGTKAAVAAAAATGSKSPARGSGDAGMKRTGSSHLSVTVSTYGDVDGPGANPWKLMEQLGLAPSDMTSKTKSTLRKH